MISFEKDNIKKDLTNVQSKVIGIMQVISKVMIEPVYTKTYLSENMESIIYRAEDACISARNTVEKYRYLYRDDEKVKRYSKAVSEISGMIELTEEGWIHIKLNSLLPHCKYRNNPYLSQTLSGLLHGFDKPLPKFEKAFLAIVEYCEYDGRRVFDQDNKGWKIIPNAIKGLVVEDDDQFHLDIGLFTKRSPELVCHIYILPEKQLYEFTKQLSENL